MPEEELDTQELKEKLEEAQEHARGSERRAERWTLLLSLSTAIIAVMAAVASLQSGSYANEAIVRKDDAILHQSRADDAWSHYQAASIKAVVYATQAVASLNPEVTARWQGDAERERALQGELRNEAEKEQDQVREMDEKSERSLHVHHSFARSVTIFQVAIALAAIAALTRLKPVWWLSLALGAGGAILFALGFAAA
jgi:hypothetical protein